MSYNNQITVYINLYNGVDKLLSQTQVYITYRNTNPVLIKSI